MSVPTVTATVIHSERGAPDSGGREVASEQGSRKERRWIGARSNGS